MTKPSLRDTQETLSYAIFTSDWGDYLAVASDAGLCWLMKCRKKGRSPQEILLDYFPKAKLTEAPNTPYLIKTKKALDSFITGVQPDLTGLPFDLRGTEFQLRAWKKIAATPYGQTISYQDVAEAAGNKKAVRAGGSACGKNPIPYLIPCHRVIGTAGNLGGFAWGLDEKRFLLKREAPSQWPETWNASPIAA